MPELFPSFRTRLPSMEGRTVVITGTTSGTGAVAADTVAGLGAKVLVLNRASERATSSFAELTGTHPDADLHAVECDLQSFASVTAAAERVGELCPEGVDVLCNNAGVMALPDQATGDGYDVQMQTNHLSHFQLTRDLWSLLAAASEERGEARVVNHSSIARMFPSRTLKDRYLERRGGQLGGDGNALQNMALMGPRWERYNQTKLANAAFTAALHQRAGDGGVKALVAHPGFAQTHLQSTTAEAGGMGSIGKRATAMISQSAADGAMGILSAMCLPEARSGQFWGPGSGMLAITGRAEPFDLEGFYDNDATRTLLWTKSEDAVGRWPL